VLYNFLDLLRGRVAEGGVCNRQYFSNFFDYIDLSRSSFIDDVDRASHNAGTSKLKKLFSLLSERPSGQAMAEFAKVSVVLFLLMFGMTEMGIVVYRYTTVGMAAREASRYAAVHSTTSLNPAGTGSWPTVEQYAVNFAPFLSTADVTVSYPADKSPHINNQNDAVVTITHNYTQSIPFMSAVPLTLTSTSRMLVSQ
jgi:Flp pilus assembly protein TadG